MTRPLFALFQREWRLALRIGGGGTMGLVFFLMLVTIVPFAIGPDLNLLSRIGPAVLWIAAVLASLLGYGLVYLVMFSTGILAMVRLVGKGPMREAEAESPVSSGRPGQPVEALPRTGGEP